MNLCAAVAAETINKTKQLIFSVEQPLLTCLQCRMLHLHDVDAGLILNKMFLGKLGCALTCVCGVVHKAVCIQRVLKNSLSKP